MIEMKNNTGYYGLSQNELISHKNQQIRLEAARFANTYKSLTRNTQNVMQQQMMKFCKYM
jgi:hypothetical protein